MGEVAVQELAGGHHAAGPGRRGTHPQAARADVQEPTLVGAHRGDTGRAAHRGQLAAVAAKAVGRRGCCRRGSPTPGLCSRYSTKPSSRPWSRSARAPPDRRRSRTPPARLYRPARPSAWSPRAARRRRRSASCSARVRRPTAAAVRRPRTALGIASSAASASAMPPTIVRPGRDQHERRDHHQQGRARRERSFERGAPRQHLAAAGAVAEDRVGRPARAQVEERGRGRRASRRARRSASASSTVRSVQASRGCRSERRSSGRWGRGAGRRVRAGRPARRPQPRPRTPRTTAWKREQHHDLAPVVALQAQIGHEAPPLGHGQQHRVERQQEADHHADRREQRRRLVVWLDRLGQQAQLVVGGAPRSAARRERAQLARTARSRPRRGSIRICVRRPCRPVSALGGREQATATGLEASAPNGELSEHRVDARRLRRAGREHADALARLGAERFRHACGRISPRPNVKLVMPSAPVANLPRRRSRRCHAQHLHRLASARADDGDVLAQQRRRRADAGQGARAREQAFVESLLRARRQLQSRRADQLMDELSAEPVRLALATSTPRTSATPTAMPLPASNS